MFEEVVDQLAADAGRRRPAADGARPSTSTAPSTCCERNAAARLAQGRPCPRHQRLPDPLQRPLPLRRRRRARPGRGAVPQPAQLAWSTWSSRSAGSCARPPGKEYGYVILPVGVPAGMPPERGAGRQQEVQGRLAGPPGPARARRPVQRDGQQDRAEQDQATTSSRSSASRRRRRRRRHRRRHDQPGSARARPGPTSGATPIYAKIVAEGRRPRATGRTGPTTSPTSPTATSPASRALLDDPDLDVDGRFDKFLAGLRANLNDGITRDNAIEMLAQHLITKPVFDALFEGYDFTAHNPVSLVMQDMLDVLDEQGLDKETETLDRFYASVRMRAEGIDNAEGKQKIITELYEKFFKNAFPKAAESLGIVYTPVEIVDFILRSVEHLLRHEFDAVARDEGVHVLDPFTGTGTFIVRLLQSGLIQPEDLLRKYTSELHANEIMLLAYYIAAVNIEATFHGLRPDSATTCRSTASCSPTPSRCTRTTTPSTRRSSSNNNERVERQKATDIRVIVGNPPYSAGQTSANDDNPT